MFCILPKRVKKNLEAENHNLIFAPRKKREFSSAGSEHSDFIGRAGGSKKK
jgi:hypothetical protein